MRPTFLFLLLRKRNVPRPVQRKRGLAAALRCLGLLRIDNSLIIARAAIWKFFRMRFTHSAAAANGCGKYCVRPLRCQTIDAQLFPAAASFGRSPQEKWEVYERRSAPVGVAGQTERAKPSFSSTPAAPSSFSQQEKKKRGLQKKNCFFRGKRNAEGIGQNTCGAAEKGRSGSLK